MQLPIDVVITGSTQLLQHSVHASASEERRKIAIYTRVGAIEGYLKVAVTIDTPDRGMRPRSKCTARTNGWDFEWIGYQMDVSVSKLAPHQ